MTAPKVRPGRTKGTRRNEVARAGALVLAVATALGGVLVSSAGVAGAQPAAAPAAQVGAQGLSAPFGSFGPVAGRPVDPPIGVPLETLSGAADGAIRVAGQGVPNTSDPGGIHLALFDRSTRALGEHGTVNQAYGMAQLSTIEKSVPRTNGYLMVISGPHGISSAADLDALNKIATDLGATSSPPTSATCCSPANNFR